MGSIINVYTKTLQEKDHANRDPQQARASSSVAASYLYGYLYVYRYSQYKNRYQTTLVPVGLYAVPVILVRYEYRFYCTAVQRYRYYGIDLRTTAFYTSPRRPHPCVDVSFM